MAKWEIFIANISKFSFRKNHEKLATGYPIAALLVKHNVGSIRLDLNGVCRVFFQT